MVCRKARNFVYLCSRRVGEGARGARRRLAAQRSQAHCEHCRPPRFDKPGGGAKRQRRINLSPAPTRQKKSSSGDDASWSGVVRGGERGEEGSKKGEKEERKGGKDARGGVRNDTALSGWLALVWSPSTYVVGVLLVVSFVSIDRPDR